MAKHAIEGSNHSFESRSKGEPRQGGADQKAHPELHIDADAAHHHGKHHLAGFQGVIPCERLRTLQPARCSAQSSDILLLAFHRWCIRRQIMARGLCGPMHRRPHSMGLCATSSPLTAMLFTLYSSPCGAFDSHSSDMNSNRKRQPPCSTA